MHHSLWMTILQHLAMCKATDVVWSYGKKLVQAVALFYLVVVFVYFFAATRVSPSRQIGCPVAS